MNKVSPKGSHGGGEIISCIIFVNLTPPYKMLCSDSLLRDFDII